MNLGQQLSQISVGVKSFLFENSTVRQTVAKNTFWLAASNFGGRFIRAIIIIYAARVLGPAEWGVFNYAITIVTFLSLFVNSGINHLVIRDRAQAATVAEKHAATSTAFYVKLAFIVIGAALVLGVGPLLPAGDVFIAEKAVALFPIVAAIMAFDAIREFFHAILRAEERMEWEAVSYGLTNFWIVVFGFVFLMNHPTVRGFTFAYAVGTGFGVIGAGIIVRNYLAEVFSGFSWSAARKLVRAMWPYTLSGALGMLMVNASIIMLGWFRSSEEVGWYSAPQRIIELIYLIPAILAISILPTFSRLVAQSKEKLTAAIEQSVSAIYLAALPVAVGGILVAKPLIELLFGPEFGPGAIALQVLLLTLLADFSAVLLSNVLLAYNRQKHLVIYSAIGGVVNIALSLLLIPQYGIVGSALATLAAQLLSNAYLQYIVRSMHAFRIWRNLGTASIATTLMAAAVFVLQTSGSHVLVSVAVGAVVYIGVLLVRREPIIADLLVTLRPSASNAQAPGGSAAS